MTKTVFIAMALGISLLPAKLWAQIEDLSALSQASVVHELTQERVPLDRRAELVRQLSRFPSVKILAFVNEVKKLSRSHNVKLAADEVAEDIESYLRVHNPVVVSFRYGENTIPFRLHKLELDEGVAAFHGDVKGFLKFVLLREFLTAEIDKQAGTVIGNSEHSWGVAPETPSTRQLDRQIQSQFLGDLAHYIDEPELAQSKMDELVSVSSFSEPMVDYLGRKKIRSHLWNLWLNEQKWHVREAAYNNARDQVFGLVLMDILKRKGLTKDSFSPAEVRHHYIGLRAQYESFMSENPAEELRAEQLHEFLKEHTDLKIIADQPAAQLQGMEIRFPSLAVYKEADPDNYEEAKKRLYGYYDKLLSDDALVRRKKDLLDLLELDLASAVVAPERPDNKNIPDHVGFLEDEVVREQRFIAERIAEFQTAGTVREDMAEQIEAMIDGIFEKAALFVKQDHYEKDEPMKALRQALEVARGNYLFIHREDISEEDIKVMDLLFRFFDNRLIDSLRSMIFVHLDGRRFDVEDVFLEEITGDETPERKTELFQIIAEEFSEIYPAEYVFTAPTWIERGDAIHVPRNIEDWSFYGDRRKSPGDIQSFAVITDPFEPAEQITLWMAFTDGKIYEFVEDRNGMQVGKRIQNYLANEAAMKMIPEAEQVLLEAYGPYVEIHGSQELEKVALELFGY